MNKIKFFIIIAVVFLMCGCNKEGTNNIAEKFEKKLNSVKSYTLTGSMDIVSNEETYSYNVKVDYKYNDLYKVQLINKNNNHEQVILKNEGAVYV